MNGLGCRFRRARWFRGYLALAHFILRFRGIDRTDRRHDFIHWARSGEETSLRISYAGTELAIWPFTALLRNFGTFKLIGSPEASESWMRNVVKVVATISRSDMGTSLAVLIASKNARNSARCPLSCRQRERITCLRPW